MCDCYKDGVHRLGKDKYICHKCDEDVSVAAKASFAEGPRIPIFTTTMHNDPLNGKRHRLVHG